MSKGLRILVVDDDPSMAKTLVDILRFAGHQVESAQSGREALSQIRQAKFDCVLSDIRMPELDGVALFREINAVWPHVPVVLMTAYSSDQLMQQGLAEGVLAVLHKPLDLGRLFELLASIRRQRMLNALS